MLASSTKLRPALLAFAVILAFLLFYRARQRPALNDYGFPSVISSQKETPAIYNDTVYNDQKKPALVAAARNDTNLTWMDNLRDSHNTYPFNVDDRDAPERGWIPANKGHEAMVYLTWIIDHYESLPTYAVFTHGHEHSWHQQADLGPLLTRLRTKTLDRIGYMSLRCDWYPSCPAEIRPKKHDAIVWGPGVHRQDAEDAIAEVWSHFFPNETLPDTIASPCCAQFAATRKAILRRPRADYERMRQWILDTELIDDVSGRVLEKLWAYIFTGNAVHCPPPNVCACRYFGDCGDREWPEPPPELKRFLPNWGEPAG